MVQIFKIKGDFYEIKLLMIWSNYYVDKNKEKKKLL